MAAVDGRYTREMRKNYGYFANWSPAAPMALGDVGVLDGYRFHRMTSLSELGVPFEAFDAVDPDGDAVKKYSSAGQVDVAVSAEAGVPAVPGVDLSVQVTVTFKRAHATYFRAVRCREQSIGDQLGLVGQLERLRQEGVWKPGYVVVSRVVRSGPVMLLISSHKGTRVEFQATADLAPLGVPVGAAGPGFGVSRSTGLAVEFVVRDGELTPLFGLLAYRRSGAAARRRIVVRRPVAPAPPRPSAPGAWELRDVSWEEFEAGSAAAVG